MLDIIFGVIAVSLILIMAMLLLKGRHKYFSHHQEENTTSQKIEKQNMDDNEQIKSLLNTFALEVAKNNEFHKLLCDSIARELVTALNEQKDLKDRQLFAKFSSFVKTSENYMKETEDTSIEEEYNLDKVFSLN